MKKINLAITAAVLSVTLAGTSVFAAGMGRGEMHFRGNMQIPKNISESITTNLNGTEMPLKASKPSEMTDEQRAELAAKVTAKLDEMLEAEEITQEQYDEYLAQIEAGEIPADILGKGFPERSGRAFGKKGEQPSEMTDEQKAELVTKLTAKLSEMLEAEEITQEQYDEYLAQIEEGEIPDGIFGYRVSKDDSKPEMREKNVAQKDFSKQGSPRGLSGATAPVFEGKASVPSANESQSSAGTAQNIYDAIANTRRFGMMQDGSVKF